MRRGGIPVTRRAGVLSPGAWPETFGTLAAILLAFFVFVATIRFAAPLEGAHGHGATADAGPSEGERLEPEAPRGPTPCAEALRTDLGERADLLDLFEPEAGRLVIRFDRSCDFGHGSDALEFVASRLVADAGALLATRDAEVTVAASSEPSEVSSASSSSSLLPAGLASRRALAIAGVLLRAGVPSSRIELRASAGEESTPTRGRGFEIVVDEGARAGVAEVGR